jgi:hypothetical protein
MNDQELERFRKMYNKLYEIGDAFLPQDSDKEDQTRFALCLAEFHAWSNRVNRIIENLSAEDIDFKNYDLRVLAEQLFELKLFLYTEIVKWLKKFRTPRDRIEKIISLRLEETNPYSEEEAEKLGEALIEKLKEMNSRLARITRKQSEFDKEENREENRGQSPI